MDFLKKIKEEANEYSQKSLLTLLKEHSYKRGEFVLASGKKSDFYINCKLTTLKNDGIYSAAKVLYNSIRSTFYPIDAVAGEGVGGIPLAVAVSMHSAADNNKDIDTVIVRKATKDHGTMAKVERPFGLKDGARVVLVEDVLTTGGSALRAIDALTNDGLNVIGCVALVDRLEGAVDAMHERNIQVRSIFDKYDFIMSSSSSAPQKQDKAQ